MIRWRHELTEPDQQGRKRRHALLILLGLSQFLAFACARAQDRPNVLFIIADDLRTNLGAYGDSRAQTPNLDKLASQGVTFTNAYCQYPVCRPSRESLMTGLYPDSTTRSPAQRRLQKSHTGMGAFFRQNGYYTARVSKIYHMGVPGGIEMGESGGDHPEDWDYAYNAIGAETLTPGSLQLLSPKNLHYGSNFAALEIRDGDEQTQTDVLAVNQAIALLQNRAKAVIAGQTNRTKLKPDAPFFLGVGIVRPHVPFIAPARHFRLFPADKIHLPFVPPDDLDDVPQPALRLETQRRYGMNATQQKSAIAGYYASVAFMDEQVGRLINALEQLGLRKNTIILFTSDHGFNLGEHHIWQKPNHWQDCVRVPFLLSAPQFAGAAGRRAAGVVELVDIYPTLSDLAGLAMKSPELLQGRSLRPLLIQPDRRDWQRTAYTMSANNSFSLRDARWRYSLWGDGSEELYDLVADPGEFTNLATKPALATVVDDFRAQLQQKRRFR